jgi:hypothetical protein
MSPYVMMAEVFASLVLARKNTALDIFSGRSTLFAFQRVLCSTFPLVMQLLLSSRALIRNWFTTARHAAGQYRLSHGMASSRFLMIGLMMC